MFMLSKDATLVQDLQEKHLRQDERYHAVMMRDSKGRSPLAAGGCPSAKFLNNFSHFSGFVVLLTVSARKMGEEKAVTSRSSPENRNA